MPSIRRFVDSTLSQRPLSQRAPGSDEGTAKEPLLSGPEDDDDEKIGDRELVFTLANTLIGAGVLGIPYVFVQGGLLPKLDLTPS